MLISSPRFRSSNPISGFTLLEVLTVVAIIGILASVVLANVTSARVKARDTQRLTDLDTIQAAVEQYYRDYSHYPITDCPTVTWGSFDSLAYKANTICSKPGGAGVNILAVELAPYIPGDMKDPGVAPIGDAGYLYRSDNGTNYCILIYKTPENLNNFPASRVDPARCGGWDSSGKCTVNGTGGFKASAIWVGNKGITSDYSTTC